MINKSKTIKSAISTILLMPVGLFFITYVFLFCGKKGDGWLGPLVCKYLMLSSIIIYLSAIALLWYFKKKHLAILFVIIPVFFTLLLCATDKDVKHHMYYAHAILFFATYGILSMISDKWKE